MSILKPQDSVASGVAVAAMVAGIWSNSLPDTATLHATNPYDPNVETARKKAAWTSAAFVSAVALVTRDMNIFILGGAIIIALDWHVRHANATHPDTGKMVNPPDVQSPGLHAVAS